MLKPGEYEMEIVELKEWDSIIVNYKNKKLTLKNEEHGVSHDERFIFYKEEIFKSLKKGRVSFNVRASSGEEEVLGNNVKYKICGTDRFDNLVNIGSRTINDFEAKVSKFNNLYYAILGVSIFLLLLFVFINPKWNCVITKFVIVLPICGYFFIMICESFYKKWKNINFEQQGFRILNLLIIVQLLKEFTR